MKTVFALAPGEDWIVDRFVKEWNEDNSDIAIRDARQADVVWLFADWCWNHVPRQVLASKQVLTTVHHIVPEKFTDVHRSEFYIRDQYTTAYHVPNEHTAQFVKLLTKKPVHIIPYWANDKIWKKTGEKLELRKKHNIPEGAFVIGSFQRDTEGASLSTTTPLPKLEKGPDLLATYIESIQKSNVYVVLAGWRRQYIMRRLETAGIPYSYFELPSQETVNELYQTLDIYPITARYEGGPQSLLEAGLLSVPCVSRNIGMASQVLPARAINDNVSDAVPEIPNVEAMKLPRGYEPYRQLLEQL